MKEHLEQIYKYIDDHRDEMISLWKELVNLEGSSKEKDNVDLVAQRLKIEFEKTGLDCKLVEVSPLYGRALSGIIGADRSGKPIIFSGHFDTVFPKGSFGDNPFRIEDGKAYGPGALDMKGGIVISLYVIKALNSIGYNERPIKIVYLSEEEKGHLNSNAPEWIIKESEGAICAFNMETGLIDNKLCVGRKGSSVAIITVDGVGSHSGNDFLKGRNAIEEAAYKIIEIQKLTDLEQETTVSVNIIKGGTAHNAIPAKCTIEADIRFTKLSERSRIKEAIEKVCEKTYIEGTKTSMEFQPMIAPYETTDDVMRFYNFVNKTSKEFGFGEMGYTKLGGGSDASYITIAKTPVLCSFGVRGQWNHTAEEYAVVESLFERAKLISTVVLNLNNFI